MVKDTRKYMVIADWMYTDPSYHLDFDWIAENGWSIIHYGIPSPFLPLAADGGVAALQASHLYTTILPTAYDHGIDVRLMMHTVLRYNRDYWGATAITDDTLSTDAAYTDYEPALSELQAQDGFIGYWYEGAHDEGAKWLSDFARPAFDIRMGIWAHVWQLRGIPGDCLPPPFDTWVLGTMLDFDKRVNGYVDGVDVEVWQIEDIYDLGGIESARYIQKNFPTKSLGINSMVGTPTGLVSIGAWKYWRPEGLPTQLPEKLPTLDECLNRYEFHLTRFKEALALPFDTLMAEVGSYWNTGLAFRGAAITTTAGWLKAAYGFQGEVGLQTAGTTRAVYPQDMISLGAANPQDETPNIINPFYVGAGACNVAKTNTFVNTGKEILMVKSIGPCAVRVINVGGMTYTAVLSTWRPTFLGPFPTKIFGTSPTITYDNYDILVTVIKGEA